MPRSNLLTTIGSGYRYTAQNGDTASQLMNGDRVQIGAFRAMNGLRDADKIYVGRDYWIPAAGSYDTAKAQASYDQQATLWNVKAEAAAQREAAYINNSDYREVARFATMGGSASASSANIGIVATADNTFFGPDTIPSGPIFEAKPSGMSYSESMQRAGAATWEITKGVGYGLVNGVPAAATAVVKGWTYLGAIAGEATGILPSGSTQQTVDYLEPITGRPITYENSFQTLGGMGGELFSPGFYVKGTEVLGKGTQYLGTTLGPSAYEMTQRFMAKQGLILYAVPEEESLGGANSVAAVGVGSGRQTGFIFRGDARAPDVIFNEGFQPRGTNTDLNRYALENEPSIFVPTSKSPNVARDFADMQGSGYVYTIRGQSNGLDVNAILGKQSPFPHEVEIAVPDGIRSLDIMGARQVGPNGKFIGPLIKNPTYIPSE